MNVAFTFAPEHFEYTDEAQNSYFQGELSAELGEEAETRVPAAVTRVKARILWPALGFPAVVTPSDQPSASILRDGDATKCICVLIVSDKRTLSSAEAARHLRIVEWSRRGRRHVPENSFAPGDIAVRSDLGSPRLALAGRRDGFGEHIRFGTSGSGQNGITGCLANRVRDFYRQAGLPFLYEIRISAAATARLTGEQYHLFWNNEQPGENALSDELRFLLERFVRTQRPALNRLSPADRDLLLKGYMYEYGSLYAPYNRSTQSATQVAAEVLHPVFLRRQAEPILRIGHVTDTHVDVRADVYEHNLSAARIRENHEAKSAGRSPRPMGDYNNFNRSFSAVYKQAKASNPHVLLMTGDLIDYGRGHWGLGRAGQLQDNASYYPDRNWFLFYYLVASGTAYQTPAYTILGNHDWRLNPYPPFAPGAPHPNELLHDHLQLTPDDQKRIVATAHGDGHRRAFSYTTKAEGAAQLLRERFGSTVKAFLQLLGQTGNLEQAGFPTETKVESIDWYLLTINPFLDYTFSLPGGHSVLMLDWAKDETVLFPITRNGERRGYNPLFPGDAAGSPKARSSLTLLQQKIVADFLRGPSRAKVVGVHAPPVSPQGDWHDSDVLQSRKVYADPDKARGPKAGHPLFAVSPGAHVTIPHGMVADRGSLGKDREREWFIRTLTDPRYAVRMVFSGHVHRNGIYSLYSPSQPVEVVNPKDPARRHRLVNPLLIGGMNRLGDPSRKGPVYVTTTSSGPRGNFEKRPLIPREAARGGTTTDPGFAMAELANDGALKGIRFFGGQAPAEKAGGGAVQQRELAAAAW